MSNISFFGAVGEVTGSCFLLSSDKGGDILIDCGMFQGAEVAQLNNKPFSFDPQLLIGVILTHAHLDHCGRLPMLVQKGFTGKVYMTEATRELVVLSLRDAAKVASDNTHHEALYSEQDVEKLFQYFETVPYDTSFHIGNYTVTFRNAGHILGSASAEFVSEKGKIIFSGDLGNYPQVLLQPSTKIDAADTVVMESTYGDRIHPSENATEILQKEINSIEESGGVLLIPAFALDRTQQLLLRIHNLKKTGKIQNNTPVFLDSPMAIQATAIYKKFPQLLNQQIADHIQTDDPFHFPGLTNSAEAQESEKIQNSKGPKVIIAGNGMMTGGRIWHHAIHYLPLLTTRLLIVGYQGEGTLGRKILDGAKTVMIHQNEVQVNATVIQAQGLSAHADQTRLLNWIGNIKGIKKVFLVHGEDGARETLKKKIGENLNSNDILLPEMNEVITVYE